MRRRVGLFLAASLVATTLVVASTGTTADARPSASSGAPSRRDDGAPDAAGPGAGRRPLPAPVRPHPGGPVRVDPPELGSPATPPRARSVSASPSSPRRTTVARDRHRRAARGRRRATPPPTPPGATAGCTARSSSAATCCSSTSAAPAGPSRSTARCSRTSRSVPRCRRPVRPAARRPGRRLQHRTLSGRHRRGDARLGLGAVDLYGDSYGTFFQQVFAGRHPDQVRSVVLDSAYPTYGESGWYPTQRPAMRRAFTAACERSPECAEAGARSSASSGRCSTGCGDSRGRAPRTTRTAPGARPGQPGTNSR